MANVILNAIVKTVTDLVPSMLQDSLYSAYHYLFSSKEITIIVDEHENFVPSAMTRNKIFEAAMVYLHTKISPDTRRFKVNKTPSQRSLKIGVQPGVQVVDRFENNEVLKWKLTEKESDYGGRTKRFFELSFNKKYRDTVLDRYLEFVMREAEAIVNNTERVVKIHGNPIGEDQGSLTLNYPITFEKLAMDPDLRQAIKDDLDRFKTGQEFYRKLHKAWKRGYLLYGPTGTGKSSLITAMANHLKYDVYDLELASLNSDKDLRRILVSTPNRSIMVIEDIDCNVEMQVRRTRKRTTEDSCHKLTLSGLLNFVDGLWSSCGDERIIVITTNHKDKLDPALLRPGRIDMEIHMSYCTGQGFRLLASDYLNIDEDHMLFGEIEDLMANVEVTPAEIAGQLMRSEDVDIALAGVVDFLKRKMEANEIEEDKNGHEMREPTRLKIEEDKVNGPEVREPKEVENITEGLSEEEKVSSS